MICYFKNALLVNEELKKQQQAEDNGNYSPWRIGEGYSTTTQNPPNCWATACNILDVGVSGWTSGTFMTKEQANTVIEQFSKTSEPSGLGLVRFGNDPDGQIKVEYLTHFGVFLLESKTGIQYVYSQEGRGGQYKINTLETLTGVNYPYGSASFWKK